MSARRDEQRTSAMVGIMSAGDKVCARHVKVVLEVAVARNLETGIEAHRRNGIVDGKAPATVDLAQIEHEDLATRALVPLVPARLRAHRKRADAPESDH